MVEPIRGQKRQAENSGGPAVSWKPYHVSPDGRVVVDVPALVQSEAVRELVDLAGEIVLHSSEGTRR